MIYKQLQSDMIAAMKAKEADKLSTIRLLINEVKKAEIDSNADASDDQVVIALIKKQAKQRVDSIEQFTQAGRDELAAKEQAELDLIKTYLPAEMPIGEFQAIVDEVIAETGASTMKEMGGVMKLVMEKSGGRADGKAVSSLVKEKLA